MLGLEKLLFNICLLINTASIFIQAGTSIPRPHGVSFLKASLYVPGESNSWTCLDGSKTIKFTQINDDYCDCPDGTDEPGTAACPMGEFHCANKGHKAENILSSRVNDGICDCCDGSDEFVPGKANICANNCIELGRIEQEALRNKADLHKRGASKRAEMISHGKKLKAERELRQAELQAQREQQLALKQEKEELKRQAEELESKAINQWKELQNELNPPTNEGEQLANSEEARLVFSGIDKNNDGFVEITELQMDMALDRDQNGVVTVEEAKYYLDERDRMDFDTFLTIAWPRVKTQQLVNQGLFQAPAEKTQAHLELEGTEQQADMEQQAEAEHVDMETEDTAEAHEEEEEEEEEEDTDADADADVGVGSVVNDTPNPEYDPETQLLVDQANSARTDFNAAESALREIEHEINEINDLNKKDYGPHEEFAVLNGQCFKFEDREYVYTLCPFDRASQKQRSGSSETTLGRWDSWLELPGQPKYTQQKYTQGASCWNGPQRTANVLLHCGIEERITAVSEPNRCEYLFEFETPAACHDVNIAADAHDEL